MTHQLISGHKVHQTANFLGFQWRLYYAFLKYVQKDIMQWLRKYEGNQPSCQFMQVYAAFAFFLLQGMWKNIEKGLHDSLDYFYSSSEVHHSYRSSRKTLVNQLRTKKVLLNKIFQNLFLTMAYVFDITHKVIRANLMKIIENHHWNSKCLLYKNTTTKFNNKLWTKVSNSLAWMSWDLIKECNDLFISIIYVWQLNHISKKVWVFRKRVQLVKFMPLTKKTSRQVQ